ncbi:MAG: cbb3-type cytochrome c oxidase subunit I [Acidimicrobiales bacterium]
MTLTEDAPAAAPASSEPPKAPAPATAGLASILGSGDHKVVGRLWLVASLVHLVLAGAAALWVAVLRVDSERLASDAPDFFAQASTYRSIAGTFLFLLPLTIGIATLIVPLQVGAATVAFPRAAAAAAWTYLLGGGLVIGAYAIDGGPYGNDTDGVRLFIVAFLLVVIALTVAWICIATTVISLRTAGMSLKRTPLFAWSSLVAATVWVLTLPVLGAMVLIAYIDIRYGGAAGFISGSGASTLYNRISWTFTQPTVYAFAIPVLGYLGSVVPVFSGTRHQLHRVAMGLIGAFAVLSAGAWTVPSFGPDPFPWLYELPWVAVSIAILLPLLGLFGLWALTLRQGRPRLASPLLFGASAGLMLLVGVAAGALQAIEPIETLTDGGGAPLYGTSVTASVASYVVLAAAIAALGSVVLWAPKIIGRQLQEVGARLVAVLLLAGTVLWSFPDLVSGLLGQPGVPGVPALDNQSAIDALNAASAVGGVVLALAVAAFVGLLIRATRSTELPGDDPWSGHTLEWATSSPPPLGNFASLPAITSEAPLYDARHQPEEAQA